MGVKGRCQKDRREESDTGWWDGGEQGRYKLEECTSRREVIQAEEWRQGPFRSARFREGLLF